MKSLAIIPARGGSKRIPKKNVKEFLGKPVIVYSIETALKSKLFDEVMVSSDDDDILEIAKKHGAKVPFIRSKENSDDTATTTDVLLEVLSEYENEDYKIACCIYPTAPFITKEQLERAKHLLIDKHYDTVFPVIAFSYPIQRALRLKDGNISMFQPEHVSSRSQDLEQAYHDCGQFYWFNVESLKANKKLFTENTGAIKVSELHAHDIDTLDDWKIAELKYKLFKNE